MNILAIDTSTEIMGIGLINGEKVLGEYVTNIKRTHSVRVLAAVRELLDDCRVTLPEINKVVVTSGPGSYTGLRIGITIAKTLAWTMNIPLSGVSTLQVMAASGGKNFGGFIAPVIDARRGNIYSGLYRWNAAGKPEPVLEDRHVSAKEWAERLSRYSEQILFLGYDAAKHEQTFSEVLGERALFGSLTDHLIRPAELARLGMDAPAADVHSFTPSYLRLAEAEAKWREKNG